MLTFTECTRPGYPARTAMNVQQADITIAIAADFAIAGEVLTRNLCTQYRKPYLPIALTPLTDTRMDRIAAWIHSHIPERGATYNIAGNGIYSLPDTQQDYNYFMEDFFADMELAMCINKVISGGQTGIDEAAIVAALRMGYDCHINAPKAWRYRTRDGKEITDETMFKARFYV